MVSHLGFHDEWRPGGVIAGKSGDEVVSGLEHEQTCQVK